MSAAAPAGSELEAKRAPRGADVVSAKVQAEERAITTERVGQRGDALVVDVVVGEVELGDGGVAVEGGGDGFGVRRGEPIGEERLGVAVQLQEVQLGVGGGGGV